MTPDQLLELAEQLVGHADKRGVILRIIGHNAVRKHIQEHRYLLERLGRIPTHDIDYMSYSRNRQEADRLFMDLGYEPDPAVAFSQEYGINRAIYHKPAEGVMAEIFFDELRMAHTLDFRGRLELDNPTVSLVDLLLSKLQIQEINEKDIQDIIVLLAEHDLGSGERELVDMDYMLRLISSDWGLYYTARMNLSGAKGRVGQYAVIDERTCRQVESRIDAILNYMEAAPKTLKWKARARIGTRMKWYQDVPEVS